MSRMRPLKLNRTLILLTLLLTLATSARATDLSGQVTEVIDGNTINLKSLSHTIKVRLLAIEPPDKNQPYAEAARKHLADLVLGKYVVVRYTGIGSQGFLVGRVLLEQADINAQMLRDGVAWYNQPEEVDLSASDRQTYPACEQAARAEKRGLWQEKEPLSPWRYRKQEELKQLEVLSTNHASTTPVPKMDGLALARTAGAAAFTGPPMPAASLLRAASAPVIPFEKWNAFALEAGKASTVMVPAGGVRNAARVPITAERTVDYATYVARSGNTLYIVVTSKVDPKYGETDETIMENAIANFLATLQREYIAAGRAFNCEATFNKHEYPIDFYRPPYGGRKYSLVNCAVTGKVLLYTLWARKYRETHLMAALSLDGKEDPSTKQFFKSIQIRYFEE
jgi:endonuclease YncB( thermonuclease family)